MISVRSNLRTTRIDEMVPARVSAIPPHQAQGARLQVPNRQSHAQSEHECPENCAGRTGQHDAEERKKKIVGGHQER